MKKTKTILFLFIGLTYSNLLLSKVDFDQYELKKNQLEVLLRLEKKGHPEDKLEVMAKAFEKYNLKKPHVEYIPDHTSDDLLQVSHWAMGGAFNAYVRYTGFKFDTELYKKDCPSWEIFNFGRATGNQYFKRDILSDSISLSTTLQHEFAKDQTPEKVHFKKVYLTLAAKKGFDKYLTRKPVSE